MDVTGLLASVLAVAVYPGAVYLLIAAALHWVIGGRPRGPMRAGPVPVGVLVPLVAGSAATAMLPFTASPALHLPPPSGTTGNVVAVIILLGVALACSSPPRPTIQIAGLGAAAVLALGAASGTVSVVTIAAAVGPAQTAARVLAASALLLSAMVPGPPGLAAAVPRAAVALAAASLILPAALGDVSAALVAVAGLAVVGLAAAGARILGALRPADRYTLVPGGLAALAAVTLALLTGRV